MIRFFSVLLLLAAILVPSYAYDYAADETGFVPSAVVSLGQDRKMEKMAGKEAAKLKKEGWKVAAGILPLEYQILRSYRMMLETEVSGNSKYIFGEALSVGEYYDAAKLQALELAKTELAGKIQTEVTALVENSVRNERISHSDAESVINTVRESKNLIAQKLGRMDTVVECYRILSSGRVEVRIVLAYSQKMALKYVREVMKDMSEGNDADAGKLDFLFL